MFPVTNNAWLSLPFQQRCVLHHCSRGLSDKEIAREMELSPGTVRQYLYKVYEKLGCRNRVEAARWYILFECRRGYTKKPVRVRVKHE